MAEKTAATPRRAFAFLRDRFAGITFFTILPLVLLFSSYPVTAAPFTVNSTTDVVDANPGNGVCATSGGVCTLRAAIQEANALAGADTISVPAGTYTLAITGTGENAAARGDLDITSNMAINGAGAGSTIIQAGTNATNGIDRVFHVDPNQIGGFAVSMSGMTIRYGIETGTGGGGILNDGTLTLQDAEVLSNDAGGKTGGGIMNEKDHSLTLKRVVVRGNTAKSGGGIWSKEGTFSLTDVTIDGNTAPGGEGGGLYTEQDTASTVTRTTINGNTATSKGGGVRTKGGSNAVDFVNVTISGNSGSEGGGVLSDGQSITLTNVTVTANTAPAGKGGGISKGAGTLTIKNTIVANNTGGDCNSNINSAGNNLDSDGSCGLENTGDPLLGPLQDNGGPTLTHALLPGSPAIDAGTTTGAPATDQRGMTRGFDGDGTPNSPVNGDYDIGAFEVHPLSLPITKQLWQEGGSAPLTSPAVLPTGSTLVFLIFVKNDTALNATDVRIADDLDEAGFTYIPGSLVRTDAAAPPAGDADDLTLFNATAPGTGTSLTDAVDTVPAAEVASAQDTGGAAGVDRITIGAVAGQANADLTINANTAFAIRFEARVK